jgi:peptidoglycan/xylan/chitin deacetylase (PgdA/CDA1 family)
MVSVTVDVDGECGLPGGGRGWGARLSSRSERAYGLVRGLPRVLEALAGFGVCATFYVPGLVGERHPDELGAVLAAGHELGHHGHTHRRPDTLSAGEQRAELTDALAVLSELAGAPPRGYRAPGWELTPVTLAALGAHGFTHDSSLMGDDRPYRIASGEHTLIELPVHWSLDDAPHFAHSTDPAGLLAVWLCELRHARAEQRQLTLTLHPEILGRPHRLDCLKTILERLIEHLHTNHTPTVTHHDAAARLDR